MLVGLGSDIIDIGRVEKTIKKFGTRFIRRIFTNEEIKRSENQKNRIASYAKKREYHKRLLQKICLILQIGIFL